MIRVDPGNEGLTPLVASHVAIADVASVAYPLPCHITAVVQATSVSWGWTVACTKPTASFVELAGCGRTHTARLNDHSSPLAAFQAKE